MRRGVQLALRGVNRTFGWALPVALLSRRYPGVPGRIHVDDQMLRSEAPEHLQHYVEDALSALHNVEATLAAVGRSFADVRSCLDLPSGYGRVTRWLASRLGGGRVVAADVDRNAVRFCAREFGVEALVVPADPAALRLERRFDLVFVGSLLTHLPEPGALALVRALASAVEPGGVLILTTQGESCLNHLDWYGDHFAAMRGVFERQLASRGLAFVPYPGKRRYGIALHGERWVRSALERECRGFRLVRYEPRGWDHHQDVWSLQRAGAS